MPAPGSAWTARIPDLVDGAGGVATDRADCERVVGGHHLGHRWGREPSPTSPQGCTKTVRRMSEIEQEAPIPPEHELSARDEDTRRTTRDVIKHASSLKVPKGEVSVGPSH